MGKGRSLSMSLRCCIKNESMNGVHRTGMTVDDILQGKFMAEDDEDDEVSVSVLNSSQNSNGSCK